MAIKSLDGLPFIQTQTSPLIFPPSSSSSTSSHLATTILTQELSSLSRDQEHDKLANLQQKYVSYIRNAKEERVEYVAKILAQVTVKLNITENFLINQPEWVLQQLSSFIPIRAESKKRSDQDLLSRSEALIASIETITENFKTWNEKGWTEDNPDPNSEVKKIQFGLANDLKTLEESKPSFSVISNHLNIYKRKYDEISQNILALTQTRRILQIELKNRIAEDTRKVVSSESLDMVAFGLDLEKKVISKNIEGLHQRTDSFEKIKKDILEKLKLMNVAIKNFRFNFIYLSYLNDKKYFNNNVNYGSFLLGYNLNLYNHYIDADQSQKLVIMEVEEEELGDDDKSLAATVEGKESKVEKEKENKS